MNKVILFLWFGDEKPPYIQWTLENFRKMNPGWEIRYIEYSNDQLKNYKDQNDPILVESIENKTYNHFSYMVDVYKKTYLKAHKNEFIVYCDLDCFPIAPFDNFICDQNKKHPNWVTNVFCKNTPIYGVESILGTCACYSTNIKMFKKDLWCLCNNKSITFTQFLQIHKKCVANDTLMFHASMLINKEYIEIYKKRKQDFQNMKINLGDNFCLTQFTPIEHYYCNERSKINKNIS